MTPGSHAALLLALTGIMTNHFGHITAVIVTYNSGEELRENLPAILPQVSRVIIVDNSTEECTRELLRGLEKEFNGVIPAKAGIHNATDEQVDRWIPASAGMTAREKLEIIYNGKNIGLGAAQNIGIRKAIADGAGWVLLLDDDSRAETGMIDALWQAYEHNPEREKIGICAPLILDMNGEKNYRCLLPKGRFGFQRKELREHDYLNGVLCVMASGSLIRKEVFEKIGLMREDFFIDYIDWEFCLRMILSGYIIMAVSAAHLHHNLGNMTSHRLLGRTFITTNHSLFRRYMNAKNRTIFWRLYITKVPTACTLYNFMASVYEFILIMLFEKQKPAKALKIGKGVWDGMTARNIRIPPPSL